jgi:hypothetical protein
VPHTVTTVPLLEMQSSNDDVSFGQWLLRALNDPSLPGVIDLSKCSVLWTRSSCSLTAEELGQLKLALQSNSNVRVLKLQTAEDHFADRLLNLDGISEIAEPLGKLTALQQLHLSGKIFHFLLILRGACVTVEGGRHAWCFAFVSYSHVR